MQVLHAALEHEYNHANLCVTQAMQQRSQLTDELCWLQERIDDVRAQGF